MRQQQDEPGRFSICSRQAAVVQQQFAKKLKKCSENPHIPSAKLRGLKDCYKIKLRASGFRLVYQVIDDMLIIAVVAVGKRERSHVYNLASERMR
ncbi:type II toxin-antitoxin system RelE/ParE family toxin [Escherichia coli]